MYLFVAGAIVFPVAFRKSLPLQKNILYLSFDDGPSAGTPFIDSIARADSVPVNVFIIGSLVFKNDSTYGLYTLYQRNPMVEMGNHSFTHADYKYRLYYKNVPRVVEDFSRNDSLLQLHTRIARLPGRNAWHIKDRYAYDLPDAKGSADSLYNNGYRVFGWDMEWKGDTGINGAVQAADVILRRLERIEKNKLAFTPGHIVILCHDSLFRSARAVRELGLFINKAKKLWRFDTLGNYPGE